MARTLVKLGAKQEIQVAAPSVNGNADAFGRLGVWPDVDTKYNAAGTTVISRDYFDIIAHKSTNIRAISLAPETDIDQLYFRFEGEDWRLLGPGEVHYPRNGKADRFEVQPAFPSLSTRPYTARRGRGATNLPTLLPPEMVGLTWGPSGGTDRFTNNGANPMVVYSWLEGNGKQWVVSVDSPLTVGNDLMVQGASNFVSLAGDAGPNNNFRAADVSLDGGKFALADYVEAGLIPRAGGGVAPAGVAVVSQAAFDWRGNPGDPGPTTRLYAVASVARPFADPPKLYYGDAALDLFLDACPPAGFIPRLPAYRCVTLPQTVPVAVGTLAGARPTQPVIVVPTLNVDRLEYVFRVTGANPVRCAVAHPLWNDTPGDTTDDVQEDYADVTNSTGAAAGFNWSHPFAKIVAGSALGGTIVAGSQLTMVRRTT